MTTFHLAVIGLILFMFGFYAGAFSWIKWGNRNPTLRDIDEAMSSTQKTIDRLRFCCPPESEIKVYRDHLAVLMKQRERMLEGKGDGEP